MRVSIWTLLTGRLRNHSLQHPHDPDTDIAGPKRYLHIMEGIHGTINVVDASESSTRYATTAEADGSTDDDHEASADADVNDTDSHVKGLVLL